MKKKPVDFSRATFLITGGTGSFGKAFISLLLSNPSFRGNIRIFSRDEFKQYQIQQHYPDDLRLRYFIGDVRDMKRLRRAMSGVDVVVHAAALKQITIAEYNPFEVIKTNILGSQNVVEAALDTEVKRTLLISSDKAVHPVNLYGATKLVAEKIFIQGNAYVGRKKQMFSVTRYGNVLGSRGSVVPLFLKQAKKGLLTITDKSMTRFWITLPQAAAFVIKSLQQMKGGEIFIPKLPSFKILDLARAIDPRASIQYTGIRPGEKIHEDLIAPEESSLRREFTSYFAIFPRSFYWSKKQRFGLLPITAKSKTLLSYTSENNREWLSEKQLREMINNIKSSSSKGEFQQ